MLLTLFSGHYQWPGNEPGYNTRFERDETFREVVSWGFKVICGTVTEFNILEVLYLCSCLVHENCLVQANCVCKEEANCLEWPSTVL